MIEELRVHGVSGTPPRDMLYTDPVRVRSSTDRQRDHLGVYAPRPPDRDVSTEAFSWSGMNSGSWATAFWILLAPFAMANVAGWMSIDRGAGDRVVRLGWQRPVRSLARATVRLAGLGLTALLAVQGVMAAVVIPGVWLPARGVDADLARWLVAGLLAAAAVVFVGLVWLFSARSHFEGFDGRTRLRLLFGPSPATLVHRDGAAGSVRAGAHEEARQAWAVDDPALWREAAVLHRLRRLHLAGGLGAVAWIGAAFAGTGWATLPAVLLALLSVLVVVHSSWPEHPVVLGATAAAPLLGVLVVAWSTWLLAGTAPTTLDPTAAHRTVAATALSLASITLVVALLNGMRTAGAIAVGALLGGVMGMATSLLVEGRLAFAGAPERATGALTAANGGGWVAVAMLTLVLVLALWATLQPLVHEPSSARAGLPAWIRHVVIRGHQLPIVAAWYGLVLVVVAFVQVGTSLDPRRFGNPDESRAGLALLVLVGLVVVLALTSLTRFLGAVVLRVTATVVAIGAAVAWAWPRVADALAMDPTIGEAWGVTSVATTVVVLIPAGAIANSIVRGVRQGPESRRRVSILWDIGSFWPRWYHPLAPPAYGPVTVTNLVDELANDRRDVLGAHSQGSLLAAVALTQLEPGAGPRRFITYGSQLGELYPNAFPAVGIDRLVERVTARHPGLSWVNLWRDDDPIGGHLLDDLGTTAADGDPRGCNQLADVEPAHVSTPHARYERSPQYRRARRVAGVSTTAAR